MGGPQGLLDGPSLPTDLINQHQLPFLSSLDFIDLQKLTNNPIYHDPRWPPMIAKSPYDVLKC